MNRDLGSTREWLYKLAHHTAFPPVVLPAKLTVLDEDTVVQNARRYCSKHLFRNKIVTFISKVYERGSGIMYQIEYVYPDETRVVELYSDANILFTQLMLIRSEVEDE